jgi:hypothetical protein
VANILAGVAHMMGYIEYTDISILTSLNQIITRLFELPMNDERLHQVLTETSKNLVDTIKEMKRMVSTSASVVSSLEAHETVVIDNSNNVSTDDHEDTECIIATSINPGYSSEGRALTNKEQADFIQLLNDMSFQFDQYISKNTSEF